MEFEQTIKKKLNKTKSNKIKQNQTKQNKTKQSKLTNTTHLFYQKKKLYNSNEIKTIACENAGVYTSIEDGGDLRGKMSSYYHLFALQAREDVFWTGDFFFELIFVLV